MKALPLNVVKNEVYKLEKGFDDVGVNKDLFLKEAGFAMQAINKNPKLLECSQISIVESVLNLALTGLTLNPAFAHAYLVPRKGVCVLDISYKGLVHLATESGSIEKIDCKSVYENDLFEAQEGSDPCIKHVPVYFGDGAGDFIGVYVVATLVNGLKKQDIINLKEIEKIRAKSPMGKSGPWVDWYEEMAKKSVIKRASKLWPHSDRLSNAVHILNKGEGYTELSNARHSTTKQVSKGSATLLAPSENSKTNQDEPVDVTPEESHVSPWDFTGDPEKRISQTHKDLIVKCSNEQNMNIESGLLKDMGFKTINDIRNKDLQHIQEYFNA